MARPWQTIDRTRTDEGELTLLQRGPGDFLIKLDNYILMNSRLNRSELALAAMACEELAPLRRPAVLIGGLGMGCTLRAALDALPGRARVVVGEINPVILDWCKGPLRELTAGAVDDPRVTVALGDVARLIADAAAGAEKLDAIILDLFQGTHDANHDPRHPFFGRAALDRTRAALTRDGLFAIWTEERDPGFERRLRAAGFDWRRTRVKGEARHLVYLSRLR